MTKKVYLICPVRNADVTEKKQLDDYVDNLEAKGISVHYPPRDVDQTDDGIGYGISDAHRKAMIECDEIHVFWNGKSIGSHFDLGMAFMLQKFKKIKFVIVNDYESTARRSYGNLLKYISK